MRFTVLGGAGFVGSHLAATLQAEGHTVHVPARDDETWLELDLGHVFYCIGLTNDFQRRPFDTVEAHVSLLARLLAKGRFERLVYLSSTRLYDSASAAIDVESAPLLLDPTNPRHLYDLSKALGENLCLTVAAGKASVARLACVYSDTLAEGGFLAEVLPQALQQTRIEPKSSTGYARDYVHIDDVVTLLRAILANGKPTIYNVASGHNTSNAALFQAITELTGTHVVCNRHDAPRFAVIDIERARVEFGFQPEQLLAHLPAMLQKLRAMHGA